MISGQVQLQVRGNWAGVIGDQWRPAVDGTINQTNESAESASTFASRESAVAFYEDFILPELPDDEGATPDGCKFRFVHADGSTEQGTF
jgi:hypothetical protein